MAYKTLMVLIAAAALVAVFIVPEVRQFVGLPDFPRLESPQPVSPAISTGASPPPAERLVVPATPEVVGSPPSAKSPRGALGKSVRSSVIRIKTDPDGGEVYFDWEARGSAPTTLNSGEARGLLVVIKDGYQAAFRRVESQGEIELVLRPDVARSRRRVLLVVAGDIGGNAVPTLRARLIEEGFSVLTAEDSREFQNELTRARGLSNKALRAWARARFETDMLLTARIQQTSHDLGSQETGLVGVKEAMTGVVRTKVGIDVEITDLRSGDSIAAVSASGSAFALERLQGFEKAAAQAAAESARGVRQKLQG